MRLNWFLTLSAVLVLVAAPSAVYATPYASGVEVSGTTVNFRLNEPADTLTYSLNGGAPVALDGTTKGLKTFMLGAPTDTFEIVAEKDAAVGWSIPTGNILPAEAGVAPNPANGLTQPTNEGGLSIISDDSSLLTRFNSPRGVDVGRNPNASNFGTVYIANSAVPTSFPVRPTLGDGMYALKADGSDAFAYGDTAQNPANVYDSFPVFITTNANSPYRVTVADSGFVYVADWSDANGNLFELNPAMTEGRQIFEGFGGSSANIGDGRNHGSIAADYVTGSRATSDLVVWTIDEDLNSGSLAGGAATNDRNSMWRYDVGAGSTPSTDVPDQILTGLIGDQAGGGVTVDFDFGADGKRYFAQRRSVLPSDAASIIVKDAGGTTLFDSLSASRTLLGDPGANDIFREVFGIDVSPDQNWLAVMINCSDVAVLPLVDGIPDLANLLLVNSAAPTGENTGRDISFDAAGNIHYASSGQGRYRVLAPGGHTISTLTWDGTEYSFDVATVAPGLAGDFNDDGKVDAADYVIWRKYQGTMTTLPNDDGIGGTVGTAHFDLWRTNFGNMEMPGSGGGAVPEPGTFALVALGLVALAARRRR